MDRIHAMEQRAMEEKETMEKLVMEESLVAMEEKVKPDLRNLNALFFFRLTLKKFMGMIHAVVIYVG